MTEHDDGKVDLSSLEADLARRAQRVTDGVMGRIASRRALPAEVSRKLARFAIPALLAAAASIAWVVATRPTSPVGPNAFDRLLVAGRPVPILELMVAMEESR